MRARWLFLLFGVFPLLLGGCLSDADTGHNRSVLPTMATPNRGDRDDSDGGKRQLCEDTVVGGSSKTVCY